MTNSKKPDFVTAFDLAFEGTDDTLTCYQFLYGSQLYGTLFGVYGRFGGQRSADGDTYYIESLELKLVNYQGVVNIGFIDDPVFEEELKETGESEMNIYFAVQGTSILLTKYVNFDEPIEIKKPHRIPIFFNRILVPLPGFNSSNEHRDPRQTIGDVPVLPFFDSEFHYRNGTEYYENVLRPGMLGYEPQAIMAPSISTITWKMPSGRCHRSKVIVYF
jgi:hypothetical protein